MSRRASDNTVVPLQLDEIYNANMATEVWARIAKEKQVIIPKETNARAYLTRFNRTLVRNETYWRICHLAALDYCCLNIPLPPVCGDEDAANVFCALQNVDGVPRIRPWTYPNTAADTVI